jgi:hypothetical protein
MKDREATRLPGDPAESMALGPEAVDPLVRAGRTARRRRRRLAVGGSAAALVLDVGLVAQGLIDQEQPRDPAASGRPDDPTADLTGPLPEGAAASCVERYSPDAVAGRAFAFDGTVTEVSGAGSNRADGGQLDLAGVTFAVNEWFSGGSASTVTVDMTPPLDGEPRHPAGAPSYDVGSRLLVSGEPRWGGPPLEQPIAWGCEFTRYYDEATASAWRQAVSGR